MQLVVNFTNGNLHLQQQNHLQNDLQKAQFDIKVSQIKIRIYKADHNKQQKV